jgi:plasmid maintenance system antidote protein VapI
MSVTKASQLIGVGRPALSNLLNGNASLSADMATRIEKAFNFPRNELMEMQARYDAAQIKQKDPPANTQTYVPPFLTFKANDIEQWASHNISARSRLSVFLRTLVHSTGPGLVKVDFPGNDDAERPGWDGWVEASEGTPWIPIGRSGWEFGTNEDVKAKADGDFDKSVKALNKEDRAQTTFVFVTPRRWNGKNAWVTAQQAKGLWKDVRAYDSSDLEQWLEQSLPAQVWFADETGTPSSGVRSLEKCWTDWANVSTPPLIGTLFNSAIEAGKRTMLARLSKPSDGPTIIAADSTEEALAFIAQLLSDRGGDELAAYRDRVLVFDDPKVLPRLLGSTTTFIPVAHTREVERELASLARVVPSFVVYPKNATNTDPHVILEPASSETIRRALEEMGRDRDDVKWLERASGRSLTVLRRQLATVPAVRNPEWANDHATAASLIPIMFVGTWHAQNEADKIGLSLLGGERPYNEIERECQRLAQLNDAPVWSIGAYRGVVSKIDLLYAVSKAVTSDDLKRYFDIARLVLGEDDPSLDLAEDERWLASIRGKTREFSGAFREGISETLVLLAVHGANLFKNLGTDVELEVLKVVRELLPSPLTTRVLQANGHDLPTYAEAAPDEFLSILERDLKREEPAVLGLLRPVDPNIFGQTPSRTGLLWALEGLSWNPVTLPRAALILARLAQIEIKDNWINKPVNSLESIFRSWMPQTAADLQNRVRLMNTLAKKFPDVAWKICIAQFGYHNDVGHYSHKPRWRPDGFGFGEPVQTRAPQIEFIRQMVDMALTWGSYSLPMLCDLIERLQNLSPTDQARLWLLVENWANAGAIDSDKAALREKIRVSTLSRRAAIRAKKFGESPNLTEAAKAAYAALEPSDLLSKHAWLFRDSWLEESADEIEDIENIDLKKREERIKSLRIEALREIHHQRGINGLLEMALQGKASWVIGWLSASDVLTNSELVNLLQAAFQVTPVRDENNHTNAQLITGALRALSDERREEIIMNVTYGKSEDELVQLLLLAPFGREAWSFVDKLSEAVQAAYWREVEPNWLHDADDENNEGVERLMKAGRPRAAFSCVRYHPEKLDAHVLFRLLSEIAKGGNDKPGEYRLEQYHIEEAFKYLDKSSVLTLEQKAGLEFAYLDALALPWRRGESGRGNGIPNLERYVELHPEIFVQAVVWAYKRNDGNVDPPDLQASADVAKGQAERGYKLLEALQRLPGYDDLGELKKERLAKWVATVRQSCNDLARGEIGDLAIGKLLSHAPTGKDDVWPCEEVRDVMEEIQSEHIMDGARTGVYNSRGVHWRGEGGDQERDLAAKYRNWAQALQSSHPFVASGLLQELARTYEREASHEDAETILRRRLS